MKRLIAGIAAAATLGLGAGPGVAQSVEDFYSGNTVRLLIGYSPGGGYDTYARLLARYIGEHIPGNPEVVVENMPGAGSILLTNYLANVAPKDGTVFGAVSRGIPVEPLLGEEPAEFDAREMTWIGSMTDEVSVCVARSETGVESWEEITSGEEELVVGGTGATSDVEVFTRMLQQLFDANLTLISGYPGGAEMALAMEQGEIGGRCGWSWSSIVSGQMDWVENGELNLLAQLATKASQDPALADVPVITEFAETDEQRQVLNLVLSRLQIARPYVAPGDIPEDRAEALRQAFMDAASDPELVAEAEALGLELNPTSGQEVEEIITEIYQTPDETIQRTKELLAVEE